ncbi:MAG: NAD(P)-binding protein [Geminicoccaceae bacterium]
MRALSAAGPIKVAIVGGGCAALTTAFELTRPVHQGRYEVTVYQLGWRLGGKGASGREEATKRIEEHGLHLWMGFYENAFRILRECYAEIDRGDDCPIMDWEDAFYPDAWVGVTEQIGEDAWQSWIAHFPPIAGKPGDPFEESNPFTIRSYLLRCLVLLRTFFASVQDRYPEAASADETATLKEDGTLDALSDLIRSIAGGGNLTEAAGRMLIYGQFATMAGLMKATDALKTIIETVSPVPDQVISPLLERIIDGARQRLGSLTTDNSELRRIWEIVDVVLAIVRGCVVDGIMTHPRGFEVIDDYDWCEWLKRHGAADASVNSAFMRGSYDLLFAFEDGDVSRPRMAAGQALRGAFRMFFTYRGALFWKMRAGMGDVVFSPLYEALKQRGVRFKFFHRLEEVKLSKDKTHVDRLEFDVQAKIKGKRDYDPLIDVHGLPCWPSMPNYDQLVGGAKLRRHGWDPESHWDRHAANKLTLKVGNDFDFVVLGIGLGAVPHVCQELIDHSNAWRDMVDRVKTVATQAFQIWLDQPMDKLGWQRPPINISGFVEPFDTWADMRQLIPLEDWADAPKAIAYFCSVLPDTVIEGKKRHDTPELCHEAVKQNAIRFLEHDIRHLWPEVVDDSGFRWPILLDGATSSNKKAKGQNRFNGQFWKANVNPTDRYILSLPGTLKYRISPLDMTYDNLTIAGDWTDCGHQAGCVEAAVMSGQLAAHALSKQPALEEIVGYDHP